MRKNKIVLFVLMLSIVLSIFTMHQSLAADDTNKYYESGYFPILFNESNQNVFENIKTSLPEGTPSSITIKDSIFPFNYRIWFAKNIVVYGDYLVCNPRNKDFKEETDSPYGSGYYSKNGERGEYRFHGFDVAGNPYSNTWFTIDEATTSNINDNVWLFEPWDIETYNKINISPYNESAKRNFSLEDIKTRDWINRPIKKDGISLTFENAEKGQFRDAHSYIHIMSPPSIDYPGEGKAWYRYNNFDYYRTFTLDKLDHIDKLMTDVETTLEVLTPQEQLVVIDYGKDNTSEYLNGEVEVEVMVIGKLLDDEYYNDPVKKIARYTRFDIQDWDISLGLQTHKSIISTSYNKSQCVFTIKVKRSTIIEMKEWTLNGTVKVNFTNNRHNENSGSSILSFNVIKKDIPNKLNPPELPQPPEEPQPPENPPYIIVPNCQIPEIGYDIVPYAATDHTNLKDVVLRRVYIDGDMVDSVEFFSSQYIFGDGNDGLKRVDVFYQSIEGTMSSVTKWVYIYDTKPKAQFKISGTFKENRKLTVTENSNEGNVGFVIEEYPIVSYDWKFTEIDGKCDSLRMRNISNNYKEFMYKEPGVYRIELVVTNSLGRSSKPYKADFIIGNDIAPAIEMNLWNGVLMRNEALNMHYLVSSVDKDDITDKALEIFYDSNNDGNCNQLVMSFPNGEYTNFEPENLGKYKIVATAWESFGQETLNEYITEEDKKKKVLESEFWVDNLAPMTDIYVDIPMVRPEVDMYIMMDKNLNHQEKLYITGNRINFNNSLRINNILPKVEVWDLKTYEYSEGVNDSYRSGTSYPPDNISYLSGGYSGNLALDSVLDNGQNIDYGNYETIGESKTFYREHNNIVTDIYYDGKLTNSHNSSLAPPNYSINEDGYSGTIPRVDTRQDWQKHYISGKMEIYETCFHAIYEGTLTKGSEVWVPDIRWESDYIGYYSGLVYNTTRQSYANPFREKSNKYIVYISDGIVNELSDLQMVMSKAEGQLILIGNQDIKEQINHHHYISKDKPIEELMEEVLEYISEDSPSIEKHYVLAGIDSFGIKSFDFDEEKDEIIESKFQYVHNCQYFDNNTGREELTNETFSPDDNWIDTKISMFQKVGEYKIFRRIKDLPTEDPSFANYSYFSGTPELIIYAHRKPIAKAELDWDFDALKGIYKTSWVCKSYDLDHQLTRQDKGIIDRKVMFRKDKGEWCYYIPNELESGDYELQYFVKDVEGVWSDPYIMNFSLAFSPNVQLFEGKIRPLSPEFVIDKIPASEYVEIFDVKTRYPYDIKLHLAPYAGDNRVGTVKPVSYSSNIDIKVDNDINWRNITYQIPDTLKDGRYNMKLLALDVNNSGKNDERILPFTVNTPVELAATMPQNIMTGEIVSILASTSKYVNSTRAILFNGTPYEKTITLIGEDNGQGKDWINNYTIPSDIPEGTYTAKFTATTPSGKSETKEIEFKLQSLRISNVTIEGYWNHWRGQTDIFGEELSKEPHRFLGLERVKINVMTDGFADKIEIRFSPELEKMQHRDQGGNIYDYKEDFGFDYITFPHISFLDNTKQTSQTTWEYVLPLAPSTKSWQNEKLNEQYFIEVTAWKGDTSIKYKIDDIDITGNIYDLTYIQPVK